MILREKIYNCVCVRWRFLQEYVVRTLFSSQVFDEADVLNKKMMLIVQHLTQRNQLFKHNL